MVDVTDFPEPPPLATVGVALDQAGAELLVRRVLQDQPRRLAHSLTAADQARSVVASVDPTDADLLVMAALLHDIGYAEPLIHTGFHPVDGANYLLGLGVSPRLAALVAHHSEARLLAAGRPAEQALSAFVHEDGPVTDALIYSDMTAGPTGKRMTVPDRLNDIHARHAAEVPDLLARRLARVPRLLAAVERVEQRLGPDGPIAVESPAWQIRRQH